MRFLHDGKWKGPDGKEIPTFPMQRPLRSEKTVPRIVAEEGYKEYSAQFGTSQSLERLGERGGFGAAELAILLFERIKRLEAEKGSGD